MPEPVNTPLVACARVYRRVRRDFCRQLCARAPDERNWPFFFLPMGSVALSFHFHLTLHAYDATRTRCSQSKGARSRQDDTPDAQSFRFRTAAAPSGGRPCENSAAAAELCASDRSREIWRRGGGWKVCWPERIIWVTRVPPPPKSWTNNREKERERATVGGKGGRPSPDAVSFAYTRDNKIFTTIHDAKRVARNSTSHSQSVSRPTGSVRVRRPACGAHSDRPVGRFRFVSIVSRARARACQSVRRAVGCRRRPAANRVCTRRPTRPPEARDFEKRRAPVATRPLHYAIPCYTRAPPRRPAESIDPLPAGIFLLSKPVFPVSHARNLFVSCYFEKKKTMFV